MAALDKMWVALIAIILMALASLLVTFARTKTRGFLRYVLTFAAAVLLVFGMLYGVISMF